MKNQVVLTILFLISYIQNREDFQELQEFQIDEPQARIAIPKPYPTYPTYPIYPQGCKCKKIDSGSYKTPYAWNSNHPMVKGNGFRRVTKWINFDENFTRTPKVVATLSNIDSSYKINLRVNCRALNINKDRFLMEISTWADTVLYGARCDWIAHGY